MPFRKCVQVQDVKFGLLLGHLSLRRTTALQDLEVGFNGGDASYVALGDKQVFMPKVLFDSQHGLVPLGQEGGRQRPDAVAAKGFYSGFPAQVLGPFFAPRSKRCAFR